MRQWTVVLALVLVGCSSSEPVAEGDADGDGYTTEQGDCADDDPDVHPDAAEICNAVDDDCDASTEEEATDAPTFYADLDGDGYGDPSASIVQCDAPAGHVTAAGDCNDSAGIGATINPGATEVCDASNIDEDCDGAADDADPQGNATGKIALYADVDGDGYGAGASIGSACDVDANETTDNTDCDDTPVTGAGINPGAVEVCDAANVDEDCDAGADDADSEGNATGTIALYADADGDGYGAGASIGSECDVEVNESVDNTDCDDTPVTGASINPGATEVCDASNIDEDCDVGADDADPQGNASDKVVIFRDMDGDGYGLVLTTPIRKAPWARSRSTPTPTATPTVVVQRSAASATPTRTSPWETRTATTALQASTRAPPRCVTRRTSTRIATAVPTTPIRRVPWAR